MTLVELCEKIEYLKSKNNTTRKERVLLLKYILEYKKIAKAMINAFDKRRIDDNLYKRWNNLSKNWRM